MRPPKDSATGQSQPPDSTSGRGATYAPSPDTTSSAHPDAIAPAAQRGTGRRLMGVLLLVVLLVAGVALTYLEASWLFGTLVPG